MEPQPRFPTYLGPPLPKVLNPLNPRHYGLLLFWIIFQPSSLLHYLWQADTHLFYRREWPALRDSWRVPAYHTLYLQSLLLSIVLVAVTISWFALRLQETPANWLRVAFAVGAGVAGVVGTAVGIGVAFAVGGAVGVGVVYGVAFAVGAGVVVGVAFVMGDGVALAMAFAVGIGVVGIVEVGVAFAVVGAVGVGVAFTMVGTVVGGMGDGVAFGVAVAMVGSRLLFYPFEFFFSLRLHRWQRHAALWSDLAVWPLPQTNQLLHHHLAQSAQPYWPAVQKVAANPFQRGRCQRAVTYWLVKNHSTLVKLYQLVDAPQLDEYLVPPMDTTGRREFGHWPSTKVVLLYEVGQQYVSGVGGEDPLEKFVWRLTRRYRNMEPTPLAPLAALLGELLHRQSRLQGIDVAVLCEEMLAPERYEPARSLPYGAEIADSFATIRAALGYQTIDDLATCAAAFRWLDSAGEALLRPTVVDTLRGLRDISQHAAHFKQRSNVAHQTTLLNLAVGQLNELQAYVTTQVPLPERGLLARVVEIWQDIIAAAQGELARISLQQMSRAERRQIIRAETTAALWERPAVPFDNPYMAGDPVYPPLFVGRRDIFNRISEVWSAKASPDSIILFGHRRMGKSSILRNLDQAAPPGSLIVYADMMGETSFVESTADLLFTLADKIYSAVRQQYPTADLTDPARADYSSPSQAQRQFTRLANQVQPVLGDQTLILALDEFEAVEAAVAAGKIGHEIYQFLRTKTQERWLTLVFGGLHTLDEMSRDYQQPFYGSYTNIHVSYLQKNDARALITNPTTEFQLNYEPAAVDKIIALSGGQPYLIQQLCRDAVNQLNHAIFDNNERRDGIITVADVEATLGDAVFQRGMVYFDGVWRQTENEEQQQILQTLAQREAAWSLADMSAATGLTEAQLAPLLRWAERQDILQKQGEAEPRWSFYVPLLRQWLARQS
ncbi:MAG: AAA family ATPase [Anaerolineales bacterium]|nr:AAA family ATPase [Anaerolineales bacterium]